MCTEFTRPERRKHTGDVIICGAIIDPEEIVWDCLGWIHLDQDRGQWRALSDYIKGGCLA
jgi:hypothetical protein